MNLEIERKFLLAKLPLPLDENYSEKYYIQQFFIDKIRYRYQLEYFPNEQKKYLKTIKNFISEGINEEIETEISAEEYGNQYWKYRGNPLSKNFKQLLNKIRQVYKKDNLKFEIDKFEDINLVLLEVELPSIDFEFEIPEFIKKYVLMEVTGKKEFNNSYLIGLL